MKNYQTEILINLNKTINAAPMPQMKLNAF